MTSLEVLIIRNDLGGDDGSNDDTMAGCIPSLAARTSMRKLQLCSQGLSINSCTALGSIFPRMASLQHLNLYANELDDNCVEVLVRGLAGCEQLHSLILSRNRVGDDGLDALIQGLPASVDTLVASDNEITLARQLSLLRFKDLYLLRNSLSPRGPRDIAESLANPECQLETLDLDNTDIGDEGAATLAEGLRNNQRLAHMSLGNNNITETGWNAFSSILCDTSSIKATHGSNHTLQSLGGYSGDIPEDVDMMLQINSEEDKSRVAARKILWTHHHLDMRPLFDRRLDLLPCVVAWLERFAESRLALKMSSIFEL